jgi:hypothetical protein
MESITYQFSKLSASNASNFNFVRTHAITDYQGHINANTDFFAILNHQKTVLYALNKHCYPSQLQNIINGYRRSTIDEDSVYQDFFTGDIPHHPLPRDEIYLAALDITTDAFRPDSLCRPVHLLDVQHHYPLELTSNAEAPFSTEKKYLNMLPPDTKPNTGNMKNIIFDFTRRWHHDIKNGTATFDDYLFYMLLHTKTSVIKSTDPNKLRSIWGAPKPWVLAQIMFHWTLFACYRRNPKRYPLLWGYETFTGGMFRLNHELQSSHLKSSFIMIDWKRFDKYVLHEIIDDVIDKTETYIDFDHGYVPTTEYHSSHETWNSEKANRLRRLYAWTKYCYRNTPIVLPDGSTFRRQFASLPSGLYTTQYFDSFYNYLMLSTILLALGFNPQLCIIKVLGDDSLVRLYVLIPPNMHTAFFEAIQTKAQYYFAATISLDKSKITNSLNHIEILSYTNNYGLPTRPIEELLSKLYYTPSRTPTPAKTMSSAVGIAYASCGLHKQVYNVCKDIYEHYQRHGITPDPIGLSHVLGRDPFRSKITTTAFPTIAEIQSSLLSMNYVNEETYKRFYPRSFFLSDF